jgi:8-oxo-dGTP pyrophosphatase MutT (NUDIX family)
VGGILEKRIQGVDCILLQERTKENAPLEHGLLEIPAGKLREYENVFDCLRREIKEETGLDVLEIDGEAEAPVVAIHGYKVINYTPFSCAQNIEGTYPILVQIFLCRVQGELLATTNETQNMRWVPLSDVRTLLQNEAAFYPMHIHTLRKYLDTKNIR